MKTAIKNKKMYEILNLPMKEYKGPQEEASNFKKFSLYKEVNISYDNKTTINNEFRKQF